MKAKTIKTVCFTLLVLILTAVVVKTTLPSINLAVNHFTTVNKATVNDYDKPYMVFSANTLKDDLPVALEELKKDENFRALVLMNQGCRMNVFSTDSEPKIEYDEITDSMGTRYDAHATNVLKSETCLYSAIYDDLINDSGYLELKEGRLINSENDISGDKPFEVIVGADSHFDVGDNVYFTCQGIEDSKRHQIVFGGVVVGKAILNGYAPAINRIMSPSAAIDLTSSDTLFPNSEILLIQDPTQKIIENGYTFNCITESEKNYEPVTYLVMGKEDKDVAYDVVYNAARVGNASVGYHYSRGVLETQTIAEKYIERLIVFMALIYVMLIVVIIVYICSVVRLWKKKT